MFSTETQKLCSKENCFDNANSVIKPYLLRFK